LCEPAAAQLGTGWTEYFPGKAVHLDDEEGLQTFSWAAYRSVGIGTICADYSYNAATNSETFRLLDSRTNRSEIRLLNDYMTGIRQFEGYVTFYPPLEDESLFQIFGNTGDGATLTMMRGFASSGGKIRVTGHADIATGVYGVEKRINVIHDQDNFVQYYVDGVLRSEFQESDPAVNYWKYGAYGTVGDNVPAVVKWRNVRTFRDGSPPGDIIGPVPGDLSGDGQVNEADWLLFKRHRGFDLTGLKPAQTYCMGDLDGDLDLDLYDFAAFRSAYDLANGRNSFATVQAVPEPLAGWLALLVWVAARGRRRRALAN
jgi:hypothetical protein